MSASQYGGMPCPMAPRDDDPLENFAEMFNQT